MKNLLLATSIVLSACGDSGSSNPDLSANVDMAKAGGGDMATGTPDCMTYCTAVMKNCTGATMSVDGGVGLADYSSKTACLNACAKMPLGNVGDQTGNTVGCRTYHANAAAGAPGLHCPHASMSGGGMCGDRCMSFCALATSICTTADGVTAPVFSSNSDCLSKCGTAPFAFNMAIAEMVIDGPTLNCAFYHLGEAFANPYDVDAGTAASDSPAGGHCDDFNPTNPNRGCQ
jgi:hypothetical protein